MKSEKITMRISVIFLASFIFFSCSTKSDGSKYIGIWVHQDERSHVTSSIEVKVNGDKFSVTVDNSSEDQSHKFSSSKTIEAVCQYNILQLNEVIPLHEIKSFTYNEKGDYLVTDKNIIYYKKK